MKKNVLIVMGIFVVLLLIITMVIKKYSKDDKKNEGFIPVYNADVVCSLSGVDNFEDEANEYSLKAYLTLKDGLVTKAILVGISTDTGNLMGTQSIMDDYNQVEGISASAFLSNDILVTEVKYDYEVINLEEVKSKLGYLLIDDSIFLKVDNIPATLGDYQKYELQEYICN